MINTIIIENDSNSLKYLVKILKDHSNIIISGTASSVSDSLILIKKTNPEIIFLDIELDDGNAFDLLDKLINKTFEVIFVTAHHNYYARAFSHFALSYLLKPVDPLELDKVLYHYKRRLPKNNSDNLINFKKFINKDDSKILLNTGYDHILISISDILYCKACQNFTLFKFKSGETKMISNSLKYYTELFNDKRFFRANRSFLVNIINIKQIIKRESLIMVNNETINISLKNRQNLNNIIKILT